MTKCPTKKLYTLSDILGETLPYEEAVNLIETDPEAWQHFNSLSPAAQQKVISFIQGNTGLKILGDKCFKEIISPKNRTDRLNSMLSAILGESVTVQSVLPREGIVLNEKGSFVVMDILVQLENGTFINVIFTVSFFNLSKILSFDLSSPAEITKIFKIVSAYLFFITEKIAVAVGIT